MGTVAISAAFFAGFSARDAPVRRAARSVGRKAGSTTSAPDGSKGKGGAAGSSTNSALASASIASVAERKRLSAALAVTFSNQASNRGGSVTLRRRRARAPAGSRAPRMVSAMSR